MFLINSFILTALLTVEKGLPIELEFRILSVEKIRDINALYRNRVVAKDRKGNYLIQGGELVFKTDTDHAKAARHVMTEALVYPDLKDKELMDFYNCVDITEMPFKVFSTTEEHNYVTKKMYEVLGIVESDDESDLEEAKN